MSLHLVAKKLGMTQLFDEQGFVYPVTVLSIDQHSLIAKKTRSACGYEALVLGVGDVPSKYLHQGKSQSSSFKKPYLGQFLSKNLTPKKLLFEVKGIQEKEQFGIEDFKDVLFVDIQGFTKGKGFQGVMKRHGFSGGPGSHGTKFVRGVGSTGQNTHPSRTFKNKKMPGRMGNDKLTIQNMRVMKVDLDNKYLFVVGSVPGSKGSNVFISSSLKKKVMV